MERIPILKMGNLLLITIQVDMHDRLALTLQDDLTEKIVRHRSRGVLIDISALDMVDSFIGRMLGNIAAMASVLDAATVVVGMQPAVAITLVELGISLPNIRTALNVERGILPVKTEEDVVRVRKTTRTWAQSSGLSLVDQTKIVTAASELARNTLIYGRGGTLLIEDLEDQGRLGIRLTFVDKGPGIADIELALRDGYTSGSGLGLGLSGAKRLSNEFSIESRVGEGTKVSVTKWKG
jgi:anti-sigma regulatory factor (Ser/Thr protein kinase)/anti-anti-sigma regulatory factor